MAKQPWINGLIDGLSASNLIRSSTIENKNRIAFIILDSTLEIAFKNYILNVKKLPNIKDSTWRNRETVNKIVKKHTDYETDTWNEVDYFYNIRTGLYHADSEKTVSDTIINDFHDTVEFFINNLFNVQSSKMVPLTQSLIHSEISNKENSENKISINKIPERINVLVVTVGESESKDASEITEFLMKKGYKGKIPNNVINTNLNHFYKHFFYFDECWKLSEEGQERYSLMKKSYVAKKRDD